MDSSKQSSSEENLIIINRSLNNISNENSKVLVDQIITKASDIDTDAAISMVQLIFSKVSRDIGYLPYYTKIISKLAPLFKLKINLDIGETLIKLYYHEFSQLSQLLQQQQQQQQQQSTLSNNNNNNNTFTSIESAVGTHKSHIINASRFIAECYRYQVLNVNFYVAVIKEFLPKDSTQTSEHSEFTLVQLESLGVISTIVGRSVEGATATTATAAAATNKKRIQEAIEDGFELIQSLAENKNIRPQTRYMLKNLIELKNNGWVLPSNSQAQLDEENAQKEIVAFAEQIGKNVNKFLAAKCAAEEHHSLFWHKLFQSLSNANYETFKDTIIQDRSTSPSSAPPVPLSPWLRRANVKSPTSPSQNQLYQQQQHQQQHQNIQQPMDIDDSFSLNGAGSSDVKLLSTVKQQQQQYNGMLLNNDKPFNHLLRLNLDGVEGGSGGGSGSSLPSGFISPKLPVNRSDMSPPTSSIYAGLTTTSPPQIANKTAPGGSGAMLNNGLLSGVVSNLMFNNSNNINSNVPALLANNPNTTGQGGFSGALTYRESPELKLSGAESDLAVILSMIESRVVAKELQTDWRSKILRRVRDMGALMKKSNKTEILAAIWQNMCDNRDDYNLYLELCLDLIKQEEEIEQQQIEKEQQLQLQKQQLLQNAAAAVTMAMPTHHQHQQHSFSSSHTSSALSSFSLEPPRFELGIDQDHGAEQFKKKPAARRSSMATLQMVQQQQLSKLAIPSQQPLLQPLQPLQPLQQPLQQQQPAINARRSSIAFPSELTRRGSMCEDSPSLCPPAPKLKSTPTLKSVSHHTTPIINNIPPRSTAVPTTTVVPTTTATSSNSNNSNNGGQPNSKKLKSSNLDSFKDVLIISLQDELALKMFIARKSLDIYFDLLKDLYKEFIIEIPLLISCIHLIQQGLYELSEVECETLFSLEEMAQEQLQASKETEERQKKLNLKENQRYEWKTGKWEEKPQDPPPPPTSFYDLKSDVFVL